MFEVCTYKTQTARTHSGMKTVGKKVVARFDDLAAARDFAVGKVRHVVQYSDRAIKEINV